MSEQKTELWLVRHGETEWSLSGAHTSFTDIPLTEHGRQRAAELRGFLQDKKFAAVLTSPRQRAMETCRLAGFGDAMQVEGDLQEWNYGSGEGKSTKQIREELGRPAWSVWTDPVEKMGGESVEAVGVRADHVIDRALAAVGSAAASSAVKGGCNRVFTLPGRGALDITASAQIPARSATGRLESSTGYIRFNKQNSPLATLSVAIHFASNRFPHHSR